MCGDVKIGLPIIKIFSQSKLENGAIMLDRIYATYTPTIAPGAFHTAIHYKRRDADGNLLDHTIIEATPERSGLSDKVVGEVSELLHMDGGPSRFGAIGANVQRAKEGHDPDDPYEIVAEGDDLGESLARMKLFAHGFNRAAPIGPSASREPVYGTPRFKGPALSPSDEGLACIFSVGQPGQERSSPHSLFLKGERKIASCADVSDAPSNKMV
jgi:hypothetical protein